MLRAVLHHLLLVLVVSCWAMSARAQATGADVLFDQGRKLYTAGKYEEAAEKFRESQRLDPAPGTLLNLAECYVKLGKTASGWSTFREAAALAATRQQQLENEAAHWGLKLYGTKPAAFVRRLGSFYRGWVETSQS